jgi:ankyrin repeat protein
MAAAQGWSPRALFQDASPLLPPGEERHTLEIMKVLVDLGANVNAANAVGDTALHRAASKRFNGVIQFLSDNGAILNARDEQGRTPLACAVRHCHLLTNRKGSFVEADFRALAERDSNSTTDLLRRLGAKE